MSTDKDMIDMLREARLETIALQAICSALLAEIAIMHPDPRAKIGAMTAGLLGTTDGVSQQAGGTEHITKVIERVCSMAEVMLVQNKPR